jgi:hypothetical protein
VNLRPGMTVQVATLTVTTPTAADRPRDLPDSASWPTPQGKRVIYAWDGTGQAICSECIIDHDKYISIREYGRDLRPVPPTSNQNWYCCVHGCEKGGDRL